MGKNNRKNKQGNSGNYLKLKHESGSATVPKKIKPKFQGMNDKGKISKCGLKLITGAIPNKTTSKSIGKQSSAKKLENGAVSSDSDVELIEADWDIGEDNEPPLPTQKGKSKSMCVPKVGRLAQSDFEEDLDESEEDEDEELDEGELNALLAQEEGSGDSEFSGDESDEITDKDGDESEASVSVPVVKKKDATASYTMKFDQSAKQNTLKRRIEETGAEQACKRLRVSEKQPEKSETTPTKQSTEITRTDFKLSDKSILLKEIIARADDLAARCVYISPVPADCSFKALKELSPKVVTCRKSLNTKKKSLRNYVFMEFPNAVIANAEAKSLSGRLFAGRAVRASISISNTATAANQKPISECVNWRVLYVSGIPVSGCGQTDLARLYPKADKVDLPLDKHGENLGYANIHFVNEAVALEAFSTTHKRNLNGCPLGVNFAVRISRNPAGDTTKQKQNQQVASKTELLLRRPEQTPVVPNPTATIKPAPASAAQQAKVTPSCKVVVRSITEESDVENDISDTANVEQNNNKRKKNKKATPALWADSDDESETEELLSCRTGNQVKGQQQQTKAKALAGQDNLLSKLIAHGNKDRKKKSTNSTEETEDDEDNGEEDGEGDDESDDDEEDIDFGGSSDDEDEDGALDNVAGDGIFALASDSDDDAGDSDGEEDDEDEDEIEAGLDTIMQAHRASKKALKGGKQKPVGKFGGKQASASKQSPGGKVSGKHSPGNQFGGKQLIAGKQSPGGQFRSKQSPGNKQTPASNQRPGCKSSDKKSPTSAKKQSMKVGSGKLFMNQPKQLNTPNVKQKMK